MGCGASSQSPAATPRGERVASRAQSRQKLQEASDSSSDSSEEETPKARQNPQAKKAPPKQKQPEPSAGDTTDDSDSGGSSVAELSDAGGEDYEDAQERNFTDTPLMDNLWELKMELLERNGAKKLRQSEFWQKLGMPKKLAYKTLDLFSLLSDDKGRLSQKELATHLKWPNGEKNRILNRLLDTFDGDRNSRVDFREFIILARMFQGNLGVLDKMKFWWRVAITTDSLQTMDAGALDRADALEMQEKELRALQDVATGQVFSIRVPAETIARFIRDAITSSRGIVKEGATMTVDSMVQNAAPSKVLARVKRDMEKSGYAPSKSMSFGQFNSLCQTKNPDFGKCLANTWENLSRIFNAGYGSDNPNEIEMEKMEAYFNDRDVKKFKSMQQEMYMDKKQDMLERQGNLNDAWKHDFQDGMDNMALYDATVASMGGSKSKSTRSLRQLQKSRSQPGSRRHIPQNKPEDDSYWGQEKVKARSKSMRQKKKK